MGASSQVNRSDETAHDQVRRTGRWPGRSEELPGDRPVVHSKPMTAGRAENAPNHATVDERGVETPLDVGRSANPPAD